MSDQFRPPIVDPLATTDDADEEREKEARERGLPEHEIDRDDTVGGGIMSQGGTAVDRGTGTLDGVAQGEGASEEAPEDDDLMYDDEGRLIPTPVDPNRRAPLPPHG